MRKSKLTFAILPRDGYSLAKPLAGGCQVTLAEGGVAPIVNRSGIFCFTDLHSGEYSVTISGKYYCDQQVSVSTGELDPKTPALFVDLTPNFNYRFPAGATLLQGRVLDQQGGVVAGALVSVKETGKEFVTDGLGRFVFYFKELDNKKEKVELNFSRDGFENRKEKVDVARGETTFIEISMSTE